MCVCVLGGGGGGRGGEGGEACLQVIVDVNAPTSIYIHALVTMQCLCLFSVYCGHRVRLHSWLMSAAVNSSTPIAI